MKIYSWQTLLLLLAVLLVAIRPTFATNEWLGITVAPRGTTSEPAEDRDGSESERESSGETAFEGRKPRRVISSHLIERLLSQTDQVPAAWNARRGGGFHAPLAVDEHLLRWGSGAPLRI